MSDKRRAKGVERRKVIIDAAIKCIATRGLCDTTLDRVAEIAGVSRTLVVFHFNSKKEMLANVLQEIGSRYDTQWETIMAEHTSNPADEILLQLISYDLELPIKRPDLISVWHTFWGEAKGLYKEFNSARDGKYSKDLLLLINKITAEGEYRNINPDYVSTALNAMLVGLWWTAHLNPKGYNYETNMQVVRSFLKLNFPDHF